MISPSVQTTEILNPKQHYFPGISQEIALFVGCFERGPINVPLYITNVDEFKFLFGRGINEYRNDWYQVYNFLQYSSGIYVVRSAGSINYNANSTGDNITITRYSNWIEQKDTFSTTEIKFIARTPGEWGNDLRIGIVSKTQYDAKTTIFANKKTNEVFDFFEDEYYGICIFKNNELVETFYKKESEIVNLNEESKYIYVVLGTTITLKYGENIINLSNGYNSEPSLADFDESYSLFENELIYNIDIIIGNERYNESAIKLAEKRQDCIAFIGLPRTERSLLVVPFNNQDYFLTDEAGSEIIVTSEIVSNKLTDKNLNKINEYLDTIPNSEYVHFSIDIKNQFDFFTNKIQSVNIAGDIAGLKAQASKEFPWIPSAGLERGKIKNLDSTLFKLSKKQKDDFYKIGLNFIENGYTITQKTFQKNKNKYNNIHIRSLVNHLKKEIKFLLRNFLFLENTLSLRKKIAGSLVLYLKQIKINKGITSGKIIVESVNNNIVVQIILTPNNVSEKIILKMTNVGDNEFETVLI